MFSALLHSTCSGSPYGHFETPSLGPETGRAAAALVPGFPGLGGPVTPAWFRFLQLLPLGFPLTAPQLDVWVEFCLRGIQEEGPSAWRVGPSSDLEARRRAVRLGAQGTRPGEASGEWRVLS